MNHIIACEGEVRVALPTDRALPLFTPEGERAWAPGWDPVYASGRAEPAPGTVFFTDAGGRRTTWIVTDRGEHSMRYARVVPETQAGTVEVRCRPDGPGTVATVRYELTALSEAAAGELTAFADRYDEMMAQWQTFIADALADA